MIEVENAGENVRVFKFDDKEVTLTRDEQVGLWTFSWPSGPAPEKLSGSFTNPRVAFEFLTNYVQNLTATPAKKKNSPYKEV